MKNNDPWTRQEPVGPAEIELSVMHSLSIHADRNYAMSKSQLMVQGERARERERERE